MMLCCYKRGIEGKRGEQRYDLVHTFVSGVWRFGRLSEVSNSCLGALFIYILGVWVTGADRLLQHIWCRLEGERKLGKGQYCTEGTFQSFYKPQQQLQTAQQLLEADPFSGVAPDGAGKALFPQWWLFGRTERRTR